MGVPFPWVFRKKMNQYMLEEWQFARKRRDKIHFVCCVAWYQI